MNHLQALKLWDCWLLVGYYVLCFLRKKWPGRTIIYLVQFKIGKPFQSSVEFVVFVHFHNRTKNHQRYLSIYEIMKCTWCMYLLSELSTLFLPSTLLHQRVTAKWKKKYFINKFWFTLKIKDQRLLLLQ